MPSGVYPRTEKHSFNKGKKHPNRKPYFKGMTLVHKVCLFCGKDFTTNCLQPNKKFRSLSCNSNSRPEINPANLEKRDKERQRAVVSSHKGERHHNWIKDRNLVVGRHNRNFHDTDYKQWRKRVCDRDKWKCKISNNKCKGRLEVHHILTWKDYPELRYDENNGIALCHFHHPRKRIDEIVLAPVFLGLLKKL